MKFLDTSKSKIMFVHTDASISKKNNITYGCPGFKINVFNENNTTEIDTTGLIIAGETTNNQSEIYAIYLGLYNAIKILYNNPKLRKRVSHINVVSDSKISILGLREWIFKWQYKPPEDCLFSSSGTPVANQEIFLSIINLICQSGIPVNLYHIDGHKNHVKIKDVIKTQQDFIKVNMIDYIDREDIVYMIKCNNEVDNMTRQFLLNELALPRLAEPYFNLNKPLFVPIWEYMDLNKYNELIERRM